MARRGISYVAGAVGIVIATVAIALIARESGGKEPKTAMAGLTVTPAAAGETDPVPNDGDAADDPAIWVHPTDLANSLILGTDKLGGLIVYDMAGKQLQIANQFCKPNNVDLLYGFDLGGGRKIDLAVATTRGAGEEGIKIWAIDPDKLRLRDVTSGEPAMDDGEIIRVIGRTVPYGVCTYRSPKTGNAYFFVTGKEGHIEQYEFVARGERVGAKKVRGLRLSGIVEGAVADDELGRVYFAEEHRGIWRAGAEPDSADKLTLLKKVGDNGLAIDVEGLTIYYASGGKGYLIASSQGKNVIKIYRREDGNEFVCTVDPKNGPPPNPIDDIEDTDGIAVSNRPAGNRFPNGLLVAQDGRNDKGRQNFKIFRWEDIAGPAGLLVDTTWDPRGLKAEHRTSNIEHRTSK
jgi:3-phytase